MTNRHAGEVLKYIDEFAGAGIEMNCQLVMCRGVNDGGHLRKSLEKLGGLYPAVRSIAAVPTGLTCLLYTSRWSPRPPPAVPERCSFGARNRPRR